MTFVRHIRSQAPRDQDYQLVAAAPGTATTGIASTFAWATARLRAFSTTREAAHSDVALGLATPAVTIVAHAIGPNGGMERQLLELTSRLLSRGWRLTVIATNCELAPHPGLHWIHLPCPKRPFTLAEPCFIMLSTLMVWRHRKGVLHTTGAIALNRVDLSTVHYCHHGARMAARYQPNQRLKYLYRLNGWLATRLSVVAEDICYSPARLRQLVAVSRGVADELQQSFPTMRQAISVIPNAVDVTRFHPNPEARRAIRARLGIGPDEPVAIFVGGDWERKGLRFAIDAVAMTSGCHLLVVGEGAHAPHARRAHEAGIVDHVHFLGQIKDVRHYYAAADVFVLPSAYEADSLVVYEAAATGLPLLVSRVNGATEFVRDDYNGWFIQREAAEIATRLNQLCADKDLRARMGQAARQSAFVRDWDVVTDRYVELYARLLAGHAHPPVLGMSL